MPKRPVLGVGWVVISIAVVILVAILGTLLTQPPAAKATGFTLNSTSGEQRLESFKGKVVMMMFGFTHCPDVCPTGLATFAATLNQLNEEERAKTQAVFISVDPQRDTVEHLEKYTAYFHPEILGLTGTTAQVDQAVKNYGAFYRMVELEDSALEYTVDHSSKVYLIDQQGKLAETKFHNSSPKDIANAIREIMN